MEARFHPTFPHGSPTMGPYYGDPHGSNKMNAWPWQPIYDKREQHDRRRQLVIAGALIAAEIERLDRNVAKQIKSKG